MDSSQSLNQQLKNSPKASKFFFLVYNSSLFNMQADGGFHCRAQFLQEWLISCNPSKQHVDKEWQYQEVVYHLAVSCAYDKCILHVYKLMVKDSRD